MDPWISTKVLVRHWVGVEGGQEAFDLLFRIGDLGLESDLVGTAQYLCEVGLRRHSQRMEDFLRVCGWDTKLGPQPQN